MTPEQEAILAKYNVEEKLVEWRGGKCLCLTCLSPYIAIPAGSPMAMLIDGDVKPELFEVLCAWVSEHQSDVPA